MAEQQSQKEYWSGRVGDEWTAHADRIDIMLGGVADAGLALAAFRPGERVLDIGCGAGATSLEIARRVAPGGSVVGVDLSPQLLALARKRAGGTTAAFIEADAASLVLDLKADAAFSRFGVMFFEQPARAFGHIRTQLRPGGRLVFACWRPLAENVWSTTPIEAIRPMLKTALTPPDPDAPGPFAFADRDKVHRILSEAGWREIAITRWDADIAIGGGGGLGESAEFLMKIGPCARAIADQGLDVAEVKQRLIDHLTPLARDGGLALPAACWLVAANV